MPQLAIGTYSVSVTKDGDTVTLPSAVTCQDSASYVQLNAGTGVPGVKLELPLYAVMSGPMYSLRAEIEVPSALFTAATAAAADGFNGQIQSSWRSGVLTISMIHAQGVTVSNNLLFGRVANG